MNLSYCAPSWHWSSLCRVWDYIVWHPSFITWFFPRPIYGLPIEDAVEEEHCTTTRPASSSEYVYRFGHQIPFDLGGANRAGLWVHCKSIHPKTDRFRPLFSKKYIFDDECVCSKRGAKVKFRCGLKCDLFAPRIFAGIDRLSIRHGDPNLKEIFHNGDCLLILKWF